MAARIDKVLFRNLRAALNKCHFVDAAALLDRLKLEAPLAVTTRGFELELLLRTNRLAEAESLAGELCQTFPDSGRIRFLAGKTAYRQKRYEEAEPHFRECARIFPHWRADHWLGKTLTNLSRFDEAWSLLDAISDHDPRIHADLGWLFERKGDLRRALTGYQTYAEQRPRSQWASDQVIRIKALMLDPEELVEEIQGLSDLDEAIPDSLLDQYVENLFKTGQGEAARELLTARTEDADMSLATRLGWACFHAMAYDLAFTFFVRSFPVNMRRVNFLTSLEKTATICHRIEELLELYQVHATRLPNLHGRSKTLAKRL